MIICCSFVNMCGVFLYDVKSVRFLGVVSKICGGLVCWCFLCVVLVLLVWFLIWIGRFIFLIGLVRLWWMLVVSVLSGEI